MKHLFVFFFWFDATLNGLKEAQYPGFTLHSRKLTVAIGYFKKSLVGKILLKFITKVEKV